MAQLRGGGYLWGSADEAESVLNSGTSKASEVGRGPWVAVFINNSGGEDIVVDVESATNATASFGVDLNDTDNLLWFPYSGAQGLEIAAGDSLCFDLSPYGPDYVRLHRTDGNGTTDITALVSLFGPN